MQMCGYLKKRLRNAKWKRMWFVLKDRSLCAFKTSEDTVATESFPILGYDLDTLSEVGRKEISHACTVYLYIVLYFIAEEL